MRVGILTGGGDCPGLNAAIRAVVRQGERIYNDEVVGFCDGWRGVVEDRAVERICEHVRRRRAAGHFASIVVVAEGATPRTIGPRPSAPAEARASASRSGIGQVVAEQIEQHTGLETRVTVIGHLQRGGSPIAFDRVLATRFGLAAIDAVHDRAFGQMVAMRGDVVLLAPLSSVATAPRAVDDGLRAITDTFVG